MIDLERIKTDLKEEYKELLCPLSIRAIDEAKDLPSFIKLLGEFSVYLDYKEIPKVDWVKKWFNTSEMRKIANENGVYFDGICAIHDPLHTIVLLGDVKAILTCTSSGLYQVIAQDNSELTISTLHSCVVRARQKNNSKVDILHQHNLSRIKINKV